ncbi:MAG: DUF3347 domain-containing protein [Victivallaceae bacterium]|nr:DUF3347 domain-containing protein [Victivallaceae bacterium]
MIYNSYFALQQALAVDKFKQSVAEMKNLGMMLGHINSDSLNGASLKAWHKIASEIKAIVKQANESKDINKLREDFSNLSAVVYELAATFGADKSITIIKFKCPMAFDNKGAEWLQQNEKIANPYLGKNMPGCGEKEEDVIK